MILCFLFGYSLQLATRRSKRECWRRGLRLSRKDEKEETTQPRRNAKEVWIAPIVSVVLSFTNVCFTGLTNAEKKRFRPFKMAQHSDTVRHKVLKSKFEKVALMSKHIKKMRSRTLSHKTGVRRV